DRVDFREQELLRAHDRGDRRHRRRRSEAALPDPGRAIDRVEGQAKLSGHRTPYAATVFLGDGPPYRPVARDRAPGGRKREWIRRGSAGEARGHAPRAE